MRKQALRARNRILTACLLVLILLACGEKKGQLFEFASGTSKYLREVHELNIQNVNDEVLFFLNIGSCSFCVKNFMGMFMTLEVSSVTLILVGKNPEAELSFPIPKSFKVYRDEENKILKYRTGFSKPMLLKSTNGEFSFNRVYDSYQHNEAKQDILELVCSSSVLKSGAI